LGKFHPQPSSLGKHSFIRLMRIPRASKYCFTCDLGCGSLTQHSNDKYSFRQYELPWSESLSLNIEEILIRPSVRACVRLSPWDHNGSVKSWYCFEIFTIYLYCFSFCQAHILAPCVVPFLTGIYLGK
jgi:hypothetical protein